MMEKRGLTLIELAIVTAIIGIFAAVVVGMMASVDELARERRTEAQVHKLEEIVGRYLATLSVSPIRLDVPSDTTESVTKLGRVRLWFKRDMMRMELPDRISDVAYGPTDIIVPRDPAILAQMPWLSPMVTVKASPPSAWRSYRRRAGFGSGLGATVPSGWTAKHQGAECLFLIVSSVRIGDESGISFFKKSEIGDADGDGYREIQDAWGRPIEFLRWAPGYEGPMQPHDSVTSPDPLDPLKIDGRPTYRLIPLIYSAGPDGVYDVVSDRTSSPLVYPLTSPPNDPYTVVAMPGVRFGESRDINGDGQDGSLDNILAFE